MTAFDDALERGHHVRRGAIIDMLLESLDDAEREAALKALHNPQVPDLRVGLAFQALTGRGSDDSVRAWRERHGIKSAHRKIK